ncbi:MAG: SDR family NAD(P)-dependent oxidoreductase [Promethearchaeota archaeon]
MDSRLNGLHAFITGASGGIGSATARIMASEGINLSLHYHTKQEKAKTLAKELEVQTVIVGADLSDEVETRNSFEIAQNELGRIDILVANAGIWPEETIPIHDMTLQQWNKTLAYNLTSVFLSCREFFINLKNNPKDYAGLIIVGSTAGVFGEAGHVDYATTKAGIIYGMVLTLKNEIVSLAKWGRVNAVCPGWTRTPMAANSLQDPIAVQRALQTMPLQKIAESEDIAYLITFLASDHLAGHLSGQIMTVAGGMEGRVLFPIK